MEVIIVMAIISVLAAIAIPSYLSLREKAQVAAAIREIKHIEQKVIEYYGDNGIFPAALANVGLDRLRDPWGNPYEYWPITGNNKQKVRKDRNTHPINTDFDLCSKGKDGKTNYPLTAHASQDDVVRANNGGYIGLASHY